MATQLAEVIPIHLEHSCSKCGETDASKFAKCKARTDGLQTFCRKCASEHRAITRATTEQGEKDKQHNKNWRETKGQFAPSRTRVGRKNYLYGIDFDSLWRLQEGACAACNKPMKYEGLASDSLVACVDHDHKCCAGRKSCGRCVRGLLHRSCNNVLGQMMDDPEILRALAHYLDSNRRNA